MRVTSKDIAKKLNLSQPTVSRILNGDINHRASAETRSKVLETAQIMGYHPNAIARALKCKKTGVFGFYTDYVEFNQKEHRIASIIDLLRYCCARHETDLLLLYNNSDDCVQKTFSRLMDGRIDCLFLHISKENPLVEHLTRSTIPLVSTCDEILEGVLVVCDEISFHKAIASLFES